MAFILEDAEVGVPRIGYKNLFENGAVTASSEATGYEKENAYDWFGFDWWKPTVTGDSWLRVSFGSAQLANYMAVWGHDLADHSASVKPQYSTNGGSTWNDAASIVLPADNNTIFFVWDDINAADWRLLVNCSTTIPVIGGVQIGEVLKFPRNVDTGFSPPSLVPVVESKTAQSEKGAFIGGSALYEGIIGSFSMKTLDPVWVRSNWIPFVNHAQTPKPFVFAWDNDTHSSEVVLAWITKKIKSPVYGDSLHMNISLSFEGIL
jgi:hypothetical protein